MRDYYDHISNACAVSIIDWRMFTEARFEQSALCCSVFICIDIVTVLHFGGIGVVEFNLDLYLNANNAHKATCRRSTSGGVVMCGGAWCLVFA